VKDGSEYQHNDLMKWYKLSILEKQDEKFAIFKGILEAGVLH
jgi:hypothetical protein